MAHTGKHFANAAAVDGADELPFDLPPRGATATGAASAADDDEPPFDLPAAPRSAQSPRQQQPEPDHAPSQQADAPGDGGKRLSLSARALQGSASPRAEQTPYLQGLNPEQREAVEHLDGPVLVLAGAGTGKTRVLTTRIAHILATGRAYPSQVLAVTFTNKAAREMKERIGSLVGGAVEGMPWLGTFHSIGVKILRRHAELVGLKSSFTILDPDDQLRLMKQVIEAARLDKDRWPARQLAGVIDGWKNRGLTPDKVPAGEAYNFAAGKGVELYAAYQQRLKELNACDFGDLLLENLRLFMEHPDVLADYQRRFRYLLVDEYQDTNVAQYLWLRLLAKGSPNVCCVGDDDQSIYGWRGAEVDNILRFDKDFPGAHVIRLERNYRSTGHILGAASGLIASNRDRLGKTLFTDGEDGNKVAVSAVWDDEEEARSIGDDIERMHKNGQKLNEVAILVRASFQMRAFEDRFISMGLPYRVIGGPRFYERQEIKDAIAYLEVTANPTNDLKFERIVNVPKRGLGDTSVKRVHELARARGIPMYQAAKMIVETEELGGKARKALSDLIRSFDRWRSRLGHIKHTELAELILDESGYTAMWQADKSPQAQTRLENLKELVRFMHEFETLEGFLEHITLVMDTEQAGDGDRVSVMTLHAAKGLEFDNVYLPGWEEGLFPHQRALDETGQSGLEEERRLAYVGITRAKRLAKISFAQNRRTRGLYQSALPSRFVDELPEDHVEIIETKKPFGGAYQNFGGTFGRSSYGQSRFDDVQTQPFEGHYGTPGWQRAQQHTRDQSSASSSSSVKRKWSPSDQRRKRGPLMIEGELIASSSDSSSYRRGERVLHQKFGLGTVTDVDGNKLTIEFDSGERKRVVDTFVDRA
ncbi:ATP-dependent helicase [Hyphomicrobium sulfonivorans]|uniref:ATP-dependent helicase n=1 Tax=Hyphomicrobium sulfonivorans TaxID=121290 RepID=UPI00156F7BEA|nr:UvrD-helicase domain-containing protein [Hyphomicrobium sulfonivorans]MBI1648976.1 UvrD-helicase domain-containing protein [Hyphomicrobium sulfonivorans]NSL70489.1 ATP-dependent DNA helicase [Hyphomicrobium sulfonivorans]